MLAPVLIMLLISGTSDWRRIMPGILTLWIGAAGLALVSGSLLPRLRLALVTLVVVAQTMSAAANGLNLGVLPVAIVNSIGSYRMPFVGIDDNLAFVGELAKLGLRRGRFSAYTICYRDPVVGCSRRNIPWFEVEAATAVAQQQQFPMYINMARDLDFSRPNTLASQLRERGYNFVVVDTFYEPDRIIPGDPLFEHASQFIAMLNKGLPPGLTKVAKFAFGNRDIYILAVE